MKMWSGRFREPLDSEFERWQRSIVFDWRLLEHEVAASRAHASALCAAGVLTQAETAQLRAALDAIAADHSSEAGKAAVRDHATAEDIHHFVELSLVERIGSLGLKLHTGRSRNEQIATDLRLYVRQQIELTIQGLAAWAGALIALARSSGDAVMPSYTHLQRAEPVLVAHWMLAYVEMLLRDISRLRDCFARLNYCPLGSGAVAGATLALDRSIAARELNFTAPTPNSMDATSDRDFVLEYLQALTFVGLHASRFAEEITLFATAEFGFVNLPEAFSTGSSAMPQKKNPDLTELLRAKVGRIHGAAEAVTLQLKGLPLAYNKDMQETQEPVFAVELIAEIFQLIEHTEAGPSGATGGVLERDRIAEASQEALFAALHDGPIEPAHGPLADPLEHLQHFRLDFGIRDFQVPFGLEQLGGADQNRYLAALGLSDAAPGRRQRL